MLNIIEKMLCCSTLKGYSTGWIGIDFGSTAIKIVQIRRRRNQFECLQDTWIETPTLDEKCNLPLDTVEDSLPPAALVTSMRWIELEFEPSNLSTAGTAQENLHRQWASGIAYLIPTTASQQHIQTKRLKIAPGLAHWLGHQLITSGLEPRVIDAPPWTLSRAITLVEGKTSSRATAILDWSADAPLLVVQYDGLPQFTRVLQTGGLSQLTEKIQARLNLSLPATMHYLRRVSTTPDAAAVAVDPNGKRQIDWTQALLAPIVCQLAEEIARSLHFLKWQCQDLLPHKLYLSGGAATIPFLVEELKEHLEIPVEPWRMTTVDGHELGPASAQAAALSALEWLS